MLDNAFTNGLLSWRAIQGCLAKTTTPGGFFHKNCPRLCFQDRVEDTLPKLEISNLKKKVLLYPVSSHSWDAIFHHFELFFHVNGKLPASDIAGPDFTKVFII